MTSFWGVAGNLQADFVSLVSFVRRALHLLASWACVVRVSSKSKGSERRVLLGPAPALLEALSKVPRRINFSYLKDALLELTGKT